MTNPPVNFTSPTSRPPASKKQRGGATPRGVSHTSSSSSRSSRTGVTGTTNTSTATSTSTAATTKTTYNNNRLGDGRLTMMMTAEDAIARRRAELRRLQAKQRNATSTTSSLLVGSTKDNPSFSQGSQTKTTASATTTTTTIDSLLVDNTAAAAGGGGPPAPPPPPPMRPTGVGRHYSDLFPTVPKSPSPQVTAQTLLLDVSEASAAPPMTNLASEDQHQDYQDDIMNKQPHQEPLQQPTQQLPLTAIKVVNPNMERPSDDTRTDTETTNTTTTTTSSTPNNRAKSAPPVRPPPPPPRTTKKSVILNQAKPTPTGRRPDPMTPSSLKMPAPPPIASTSNTTTTTTNTTNERPRSVNEKQEQTEPALADDFPVTSLPPLIPVTKPFMLTTTTASPALVSPSSPPSLSVLPSSSKRDKINLMLHAVAKASPAQEQEEKEEESNNNNINKIPTVPSPTKKKDQPPIPARRPAQSPESGMATNENNNNTATTTVPLRISESQQRLEQAYHQAEQDKTTALLRIKELEDLLIQAHQKVATATIETLPPPGSLANMADYQYLLQLAETDGPQAALEWVKNQQEQHQQQPSSSTSTTTQFSNHKLPMNNNTTMSYWRNVVAVGPTSPRRFPRRVTATTTSTIHPILPHTIPSDMPMVQVEKQFLSQFQEAAQYVPYQFTSALATYVVRRPYGTVTAPELFDQLSLTPDEVYRKRAHVTNLAALEVAVTIVKDQSSLLLFDKMGVRYQTPTSPDWKLVANVEEDLDRPQLGYVTYIDEQANELEYSLDDVLDEALMVREQYSSAVINTALGLKDRPTPSPTTLVPAVSVTTEVEGTTTPSLAKAPSKDVAVETDEKGMMTAPATSIKIEPSPPTDVNTAVADNTKAITSTTPPSSSSPDETTGSSDILTLLMSMILSSVVGLIYFVLIGLPWKIVQTIVIMTAIYTIVNLVFLYMAQDYNTWLIRESGGTVTLQDLAYFTNNHNMHHGIM
jgi:hypothetical protein